MSTGSTKSSKTSNQTITQVQLEKITKHFCENRHNVYGVKIPMYYDETAIRDMKAALEAGGIDVGS